MTEYPTDVSSWDIAAERDRLASQLADVRSQPGAPLGEDADVLAMSLPPYATACPNPDLSDWLTATEPVGHADRKYVDPGPFTTDISEGKSSLFYKAHSYPTKVPHEAIMRFLLHYTEPGDLVLDGFCGTGMTGVAAQACGAPTGAERREIEHEMGEVRWGSRRAVLADLSPLATFIAAGLNLPINAESVRSSLCGDSRRVRRRMGLDVSDDRRQRQRTPARLCRLVRSLHLPGVRWTRRVL